MVDEANVALYQKALTLTGETTQIDIAIEECSELIQALIKYKRNKDKYAEIAIKDNIAEESGDVLIMIEQMLVTFDLEEQFQNHKARKIERLKQRLAILEGKNEEKENGHRR